MPCSSALPSRAPAGMYSQFTFGVSGGGMRMITNVPCSEISAPPYPSLFPIR